MTGKVLTLAIVLSALIAGVAMYYLQVYAYYVEVTPDGVTDVQILPQGAETPETILYERFQAIDADSSPIRFRACFTTPTPLSTLRQTYTPYPAAEPLVAPGWFDCFDAEAIGTALSQRRAEAFLGARNFEYGIDRVIAVTDAGEGYIWHQVNDCGDRQYDGSPVDPSCPPRPEAD